MDSKLKFDYYYGNEAEQFSFYRVPRILIKDSRFKDISSDAKLLYGLMLDRMSLSMKNGWLDEKNRAYIYYTVEDVMDDLCCGREKVAKIFKELDSKQGIGLIEKVRQGLGRPDKIYVKNFMECEEESSKPLNTTDIGKTDDKKFDEDKDGNSKIELLEEDEFQEIGKSNFCETQEQISRNPKIEFLEVRKSNANYTNNNYTEDSYTNHIYLAGENTDVPDGIDLMKLYMQVVKTNIRYDEFMENPDYQQKNLFEEIYNTIIDLVCVTRKTIRISGEDYPYALVKDRMLKLRGEHIEYVIDMIGKNTKEITNMKAYLVTALYNAPTTFNIYLSQKIQHDMYGGE